MVICRSKAKNPIALSRSIQIFSGMGILGLQNLHYLAKYKKTGSKLLAASNHPQYGFSLAITSINLTAVLMQMLESGLLRSVILLSHFYLFIEKSSKVSGDQNLDVRIFREESKIVFITLPCFIGQSLSHGRKNFRPLPNNYDVH